MNRPVNQRRIAFAAVALLLAVTAARHPTADIQVLTHDADDVQPRRVQAGIDLGLVGVKLLVTWTAHQLR